MKINQTTSSRPGDASDGAVRSVASAPAQTPAPTPDTTGVRVSPLAAQVREIGSRLVEDSDDDIDTAKVDEIRQAISEGRIKIDPSKIADGLLASLRELNGSA
ncbi:flagellar biosynthesis anti-sigma factor FlgM [Cupriavidus basilensis]|uniref:Negative regulator of flagellin synthesis n=1 Tax=Cupriavidus basilensis TaxID=68895 RepID=A0ABT6ARL3_9BURK|nr:flagellar biosynthesis anti-sigma factor FlgM [Cupriavidus basilensis]MDF3834356.1 flagellar biosynthesis anti-sigma factor FlgM [Cupriavidus basilensis]